MQTRSFQTKERESFISSRHLPDGFKIPTVSSPSLAAAKTSRRLELSRYDPGSFEVPRFSEETTVFAFQILCVVFFPEVLHDRFGISVRTTGSGATNLVNYRIWWIRAGVSVSVLWMGQGPSLMRIVNANTLHEIEKALFF